MECPKCPRCSFAKIQPKLDYLISSCVANLCFDCMKIATSFPYTYVAPVKKNTDTK